MKITIERSELLRALNHVHSVVERRNTIPILSNVLIETIDGGINLTATDMDIAIVEKAIATINIEGATTVPVHTIYDIIRKLPDGSQVVFNTEEDNDKLVLTSGRSRFSLQTLPSDDFPTMAGGDMPHSFKIGASEIKSIIDRTKFAISTEETRYYLNGIYIHITSDNGVTLLRGAATDGHRLARVEIPAPDGSEGIPGIIIPRKAIGELRKLIDETTDAISISLSTTKICFSFDDAILTSKLIDGTFPDYERVIPTANDKSIGFDCRNFAAAVDRVATIATEKTRGVKMQMENNVMTLSVSSQDNGTAREEISIDYDGEAIEAGFNSRYLLDVAQLIESGNAEFLMADAASPTIVRDVEDLSALYVLMPMRV